MTQDPETTMTQDPETTGSFLEAPRFYSVEVALNTFPWSCMVKSLGLVSRQHLPATPGPRRPGSTAPPRGPSEGACQGRDQALGAIHHSVRSWLSLLF